MPRKEDALKKIAKERMGEMFGEKEKLRGLNAFFPKSQRRDTLSKKSTVSKEATVSKKVTVVKTPTDSKKPTVFKTGTVSKMDTVAKKTTVSNEEAILRKIGAITKSTPQLVYLKLYQLTHGHNTAITDWLGYRGIAELCNISNSTARRAIRILTGLRLIERTEIKNEKDVKGSKYKINIPPQSKLRQ